jgi:hypothetical protein
MKNYLELFFERFDYPAPAREALLIAYDAVQLDTEARQLFNGYLADYKANTHCDFGSQIRGCGELGRRMDCSPYTLQLLLFLCHTKHSQELYRQAGLDEQIWQDSMLDLKYKLDECHAVYGVWGSFVCDWFPRFFTLERFTFGRLQFEWEPLSYDYQGQGLSLAKGSRVVQLHIPRSGQPLSQELCDDAFARAVEFYTPQLQEGEPLVFTCSSWLLYPRNRDILPERSNIRGFMQRFDIYHWGTHGGNHPDLWRLFDTMEKNPDRLPTDSSLRRAYVEHLKKGGKTGWGYGVIVAKK